VSKDSLVKGTIILAAAAFVARALGLLQKVPLQHILGDDGLAPFGIAYNVYGMLLIVATAGIPSALSKMVSERYALGRIAEARRIYRAAAWFAAAAGAASCALLYAAAPWYAVRVAQDPHAVWSIRAIAPALVLFPLIAIMRGYFQGRQVMIASGLSQILEQILRVGTAVGIAYAMLLLGYASEYIAAGASFGAVAGAVAALAVMVWFEMRTRRADRRAGLDPVSQSGELPGYRAIYRQVLRLSVPISLISLAVPLIFVIDSSPVIPLLKDRIGYSAAREALGILTGKAQSLAGIPPIIAIALSTSIVPVISSAYARRDRGELEDRASEALRIALITGLPLAVILAAAAKPVIGFLFSDANGWDIAALLTFSTLFQVVMMASSAILMGLGNTMRQVGFLCVGIAVKFAGSFALAPLFGIHGIVGATLLAFATIMFLNLRELKKMVDYRIFGRRWPPFVASAAALAAAGAACAWCLDRWVRFGSPKAEYFLQAAALGALLSALYAFLLLALRVVRREDLRLFPAPVRRMLDPFFRLTERSRLRIGEK